MSKSPEALGSAAVLCRDVRKEFFLYQHRTTSLREWFIRAIKRQPIHVGRASFMLKDFNLRIARGEVVGLIGKNGSGKSTALRLIGGIYRPTAGTVETHGRVTAVFELGTGFSSDLTGAENIALKAVVMGLSSEQIDAQRDAILEFAELGDFINTPMRFYSSGMVARLAFAIAFCVKPDILLLDEVLAVGDEAFKQKCIGRLKEFCAAGGTMIIASHAAPMVRQLCTRAVWLENGTIRMDDDVNKVLKAYIATFNAPPQSAPQAPAKAG